MLLRWFPALALLRCQDFECDRAQCHCCNIIEEQSLLPFSAVEGFEAELPPHSMLLWQKASGRGKGQTLASSAYNYDHYDEWRRVGAPPRRLDEAA
eukprot:s718_g1.t1